VAQTVEGQRDGTLIYLDAVLEDTKLSQGGIMFAWLTALGDATPQHVRNEVRGRLSWRPLSFQIRDVSYWH
jgi:hypothetical protein